MAQLLSKTARTFRFSIPQRRAFSLFPSANNRSHTNRLFDNVRQPQDLHTLTLLNAADYEYRDRRDKKNDFRRLWITRINAAARQEGLSYSVFMSGLRKAGVEVNRKILADLAAQHPDAFRRLVDVSRGA